MAFARKLIGLLAAAYLLYLAVVAIVIVPAANGLLPGFFRDFTGRTLQFENLTLNPFTLAIELDGVRNDNPDGSPFFAAQTVRADLALASLWRGPTLDDLDVRGLDLHIAQTAADRYNFSDMLDHLAARLPPAPADDNTPATPLDIRRLHIDSGEITLHTPHSATPVQLQLQGLTLNIDQLSTRDSPREVTTDTSAALPAFNARRLALALQRANIELPREPQPYKTFIAHAQAQLELFSTREREAQPFAIAFDHEGGGHVSATGQLSLAGAQSRGEFTVDKLQLPAVWRYIELHMHGALDQGTASLAGSYEIDWRQALRYRADLRSATLNAVRMHVRDYPESGLDFAKLALRNLRVDSEAHRVHIDAAAWDGVRVRGENRDVQISLLELFKTEFAPSADDDAPGWQLQLDQFALNDGRIDWRTNNLDVEKLAIAPLTISGRDIYWPEAKPAALKLDARINEATALTLQAALTPYTQSGSVQGEIKGLPLTWGNRLLAQQLTARITQGALDTQFTATLENGAPQQLTADGAVADFQLLRSTNNSQVAAWKRLDWQQLAVDMDARTLHLARADFREPQLRVRINPDGTTNLHELVIKQHAAAKKSAPAEPAKPTPEKQWQTEIALVHLDNGALNFRDNSLPRPFAAYVGEFTGDIEGISSRPDKFARVDLRGSVDGYAPVSLTGHFAPLRDKPALELALDFTNLDLATLTNYSRTYAGYAINRGLLTLQLAYKLEDNRLQGSNRIVITKLELGEKVESTKAVDLPLKLAIALLTDENGVIDLGVGVEGDLDNPEFSVRGIIWKALRNVIMKAVTSPFRLLGSLVGAGASENLGVVDFEAGTDQLDAASRERLAKAVEALAKRPALQLRVVGHADMGADGGAMRQGKLEYFLETDGVDEASMRARDRSWQKAVVRLYEKTYPERPIGERTPEQLAVELRDGMTLGSDAMGWLAGRRALAVKRVLVVELGMPADRVLIEGAPENKEGSNRTQAELHVDA